MIAEPLDAWILNRRWVGDTSAIVTLFTREQGIISASYRGGRTPKKQANLQVFTPVWVVLNKRHDWCYLQQIEVSAAMFPLNGHHLFAGLYVNELLYHALRPCDPYPCLYDKYEDTVRGLSQFPDKHTLEASLRQFELKFLTSCGYEVSYEFDTQGVPIRAENSYNFVAGEGFTLAARAGISGEHLLAIGGEQFHDSAVLKAAKLIMRAAIDYALDGKPIKARGLYKSITNGVRLD